MMMRAAVAAAPRGLRRLFSTNPPHLLPLSLSLQRRLPKLLPLYRRRIPAPHSWSPNPLRLSKRTTTEDLRAKFQEFGQVVHARVETCRVSGNSKGFGFVQYATLEDAAKGIKGMDEEFLDGWVIFAEYSPPDEAASITTK